MITRDSIRTGDLPTALCVAVDATVLINFLILKGVDILGRLQGYRFVIPDTADAEVIQPQQRIVLHRAFDSGFLERHVVTDPKELQVFAELLRVMGVGEAACLAAADHRGWLVASDEGRVFRRIAVERIGEDRILTTPTILAEAFTEGMIRRTELQEAKLALERHRLTIPPGTLGPLFPQTAWETVFQKSVSDTALPESLGGSHERTGVPSAGPATSHHGYQPKRDHNNPKEDFR